jgi:hypothetical protein
VVELLRGTISGKPVAVDDMGHDPWSVSRADSHDDSAR